jgi:hypothetical protein
MNCENCGKTINETDNFCEFCGARRVPLPSLSEQVKALKTKSSTDTQKVINDSPTPSSINMEDEVTKSNYKNLLDKILKTALIIGALVVSISVAYYLVIFLPQKESAKQEQQRQAQALRQAELELQTKKESSAYLLHQQDNIVKRKATCHEIEVKERKDYPNVVGGAYDEETDICTITYTAPDGSQFTNEY